MSSRAEFEAWVDGTHGLWIAPNDDGTYADSRTQYMWGAWQAAAAAEREACCHVINQAGISGADMPHTVVQKYVDAIRRRGEG